MNQVCEVLRLGLVPYLAAWALQEQLAQEIAEGERPPTLLLLEHPHTFTFGRRGQAENLLWDAAELRRRGVEVHWVDRGGDVTYHGPGQLVGYPLLPLAPGGLNATLAGGRLPKADYVGYVRNLERVLILALGRLGVAGEQVEGLTGVWVCPPGSREMAVKATAAVKIAATAKIAAIGVKVDARGISRHGFALNVAPDPAYWEGIIGCGLKTASTASLADYLSLPPSMEWVMERVVEAFGLIFGFEMVEVEKGSGNV